MTNAELNARAAEIMGWKKDPINREWYISDDGKAKTTHLVAHWNPAENIAQAFELVEKSGHLQLTQWGNWGARIIPQNTNPIAHGYGDTAALAITRACVAAAEKATG